MPNTATAPKTWPTLAEFEVVADCMGGDDPPYEHLDGLASRIEKLGVGDDLDGTAIPVSFEPITMETLGALTSCLAKVRMDLELALGTVSKMEGWRDELALEAIVVDDAEPRVSRPADA